MLENFENSRRMEERELEQLVHNSTLNFGNPSLSIKAHNCEYFTLQSEYRSFFVQASATISLQGHSKDEENLKRKLRSMIYLKKIIVV